MTDQPKKLRGFARLSPERRKEVAAMGGASVPNDKRTFSKDKNLAASAGAKGGSSGRITAGTVVSRHIAKITDAE